MSLSARITILLRKLDIDQNQLAEKLNVKPQAVSNWMRNKNKPGLSNLKKLAALAKEPLEYFSDAEKTLPYNKIVDSYDPDHENLSVADIDNVRHNVSPGAVPEFDLRGRASYGGGHAQGGTFVSKNGNKFSSELIRGEWTFPEYWLRGEMRLRASLTDVIAIDGPSMSPDLEPGDRVLIDRSDRDPRQDAIFAIRDGESVIVKHVQLIRGSQPPRITCRSSNPAYGPFELVLDEIQASIVGRVAGRITKM